MTNVKKPPRELAQLSTREFYKILVKVYQNLKLRNSKIKKFNAPEYEYKGISSSDLERTYNISPGALDKIVYGIGYIRNSQELTLDFTVQSYSPRIRFGFKTAHGAAAVKARTKFHIAFIPQIPKLIKNNIWAIGNGSNGMITFYKGDRPTNEYLSTKDLTYMKPGRFFTKYLKLKPAEAQELAESYNQAFIEPELSMEIKLLTHEEDISWAYYEENYTEIYSGDCLGNSCMRHEEFKNVVKHYAYIGAGLLVGLDQYGKVLARAIYWPKIHNARNGETTTYVDRIYHAGNYDIKTKLLDYCEERGWRTYNSNIPGRSWYYLGPEPLEESCPYHDTFVSYDSELGRYTPDEDVEYGYCLTNTDGTATEVDQREERVTLFNGDEVPESETCFVRRYGGYFLIDECVFSTHERSYIPLDEAVEVRGIYYYEDDEELVEDVVTGETIHTSHSVELTNGLGYTATENAISCPITEEIILRDAAYQDQESGIYFASKSASDRYFSRVTQVKETVEQLTIPF